MNAADIEVEFSKSEWGLGQQEVNLRYADALEMADRHALYKTGVKEMSARGGNGGELHGQAEDRRHRLVVPCPPQRLGRGRRAAHCCSGDGEPGDSASVRGTSSPARSQHGPELAVTLAPNVNSYKRFQLNQFAGVNFAWGLDNRTCGLRVVGDGPSMRLEHRIPGADANPYLAIAALAAAGLAGHRGRARSAPRRWPPTPPITASARGCPVRSGDALALLRGAAHFMRDGLRRRRLRPPGQLLRQELDAFNHETVTDWELIRYFERV